jgi:hypothetical protein
MGDGTCKESLLEFEPPPTHRLKKLKDVSEVYPGTEHAVLVLRALLDDGTYAVWSESRASSEPCMRTIICRDAESSFAAFHEMVHEFVAWAYPEACA